ncbi:MAG: amidohydrolase [Gemmatimonadota bacterium]|nr:amidohydrolase [Gemmatimonadota bacterium]
MFKNKYSAWIISFTIFLTLPCHAPAQGLDRLVRDDLPGLMEMYRERHLTPELSYFEKNTSEKLARELSELGFEVTRPVGKFPGGEYTCYGVVAVMENGEGPTVLVRTDMDALPIDEKTGAPFASTVRMKDVSGEEVSVMHACGHDMHQTVLVGTARVLTRMKDRWSGTLIMIGQPAEERGSGARAMLADGLFERWPVPDYCLAEHVDPTIETGKVGYCAGYAMANVDMLNITIHGVGAHGAKPHQGRDPVVIAAQVINALQTVVSREIDPVEPAVVTVGSIHGGTKHNIIPDQVHLQLTVRSFSPAVRQTIIEAIERITVNTCRAAGLPEELMPVIGGGHEYTPSLYNDPALTDSTARAFRIEFGEENVVEIKPATSGEDFSEYGRTPHKVPILMFRLGSAEPGSDPKARPGLHSPFFIPVTEPTIITGVRAMTAAVLNLMGK